MNKYRIPLIIITTVVSAAVLPFLLKHNTVSTDISVLLPESQWIKEHLDFLRNSQLSAVTAVSIKAESKLSAGKIPELASHFAADISPHPHIKEVYYRISPEILAETALFLCPRAPQVLNSSDFEKIRGKLKPGKIQVILTEQYEKLLRPGGMFLQKTISADPLDIYSIILSKIRNTCSGNGFKAVLHDNGLWSRDGRNFLILIYSDIPVTDAELGADYLKMLEKELRKTFPGPEYSYTILSGHRHAIINRKMLEHDITLTMAIAAIGFFMLFIILFRTWRAIFVFIIPIAGMICAVGLTWLFFKNPSAIILGLGATVIGIALDYGIHVFVSGTNSECTKDNMKLLTKPLVYSALTTLGVFIAFFFSETPGYHQLAFASSCGIAVSLLLSLTCLPAVLPSGSQKKMRILQWAFPAYTRMHGRKVFSAWVVLAIAAGAAYFKVHFEPDIRKLDGADNILKQQQQQFEKIWGNSMQAAVTVTGTDTESVMQIHDKLKEFASENKVSGYQSLSALWPSFSTREKNLAHWNKFWDKKRIGELKHNLFIYGRQYGFADNAFQPFFEHIYSQNTKDDFIRTKAFSLLARKFMSRHNTSVRINAFFPDTAENVHIMQSAASKYKNCSVISPKFFGVFISEQILNDALLIAAAAVLLVITLAFLCLRSISKTLYALIPVLSAVLSIGPVYLFSGREINAIAMVALIVVTGLAIDYGIFAVSALEKNTHTEFSRNAATALTVSMLSTVIGSIALLWASHPALQTVGIVITSGVLAAYFSAVFIVPAVAALPNRSNI